MIRDTETHWDKIDGLFKAAGKAANAAEVAATVITAASLDRYITAQLMNNIDKNSELYKGLQEIQLKQRCPASMIVAELLKDDVISLIVKKMVTAKIENLASIFAGTEGIKIGMATTVASIGYYVVGSVCDYFGASSDEVISACISICNQITLSSALTTMRSDMRSAGSGKGYKESYTLLYKAYMAALKDGYERVLKISKKGGNRKQLEEDYKKYEKYLSYERYLDSCLKNANASLNYSLSDGKAIITGYNKKPKKTAVNSRSPLADSEPDSVAIDIPDTIDGYEVIAVSKSAFQNDTSIYGVYVPNGVTSIGEKAFMGCTNLKDVFIEDGLETIESGAFSGCTSLETVELPDSITSLGDSVFEGVNGVTIKAKDTTLIDQYIENNDDNVASEKIPPEVTEIIITKPADKQSYKMSEIAELEQLAKEGEDTGIADLTGLELKAKYDDGSEEEVTEGFTGFFEEKKLGKNTIRVCYGAASTSFTVDVTPDECSYEIVFVDEYGKMIADSLTGTAIAGSEVNVEGVNIEGYRLISEPRSENIGASNYFVVQYETIRKPSIGDAEIVLSETSYKYSGKEKKPEVIVSYNGKPLTLDEDYTLEYDSNIKPGNAAVVISGTGAYEGQAIETYTINKANNPLSVKGKTATIKYSKLKRKAQYLLASKIIRFINKGQGTKTYTLSSVYKGGKSYKKYFKVSASTGKLTVKKGLKKGIYTVKVKVKAKGNTYYNASIYKTATIKIKVK